MNIQPVNYANQKVQSNNSQPAFGMRIIYDKAYEAHAKDALSDFFHILLPREKAVLLEAIGIAQKSSSDVMVEYNPATRKAFLSEVNQLEPSSKNNYVCIDSRLTENDTVNAIRTFFMNLSRPLPSDIHKTETELLRQFDLKA